MEYKNRIYFIREESELTQKEVAKELEISRSHYSNIELNIYDIRLETLNKFCNLFHVDMDYVFCLSNIKHNNTHNIETINRETISTNLKIIMKEHHLNQTSLANCLHCSQQAISKYLNGNSLILTVFAIELAKKYNYSLDWFVGRSNNKKRN